MDVHSVGRIRREPAARIDLAIDAFDELVVRRNRVQAARGRNAELAARRSLAFGFDERFDDSSLPFELLLERFPSLMRVHEAHRGERIGQRLLACLTARAALG